MIIIRQTNVFVVNSSLFSFNYLLYEILVQLLIGLLENAPVTMVTSVP